MSPLGRVGWANRFQGFSVAQLQQQLAALNPSEKLPTQTISGLVAILDPNTNSVQINFTVATLQGLASLVLMRNFTMDTGTATVLNTWTSQALAAIGSAPYPMTYSDTDPALVGQTAYYWIKIVANVAPSIASYFEGPALVDQSEDAGRIPYEAQYLDASHDAADAGFVNVSVAAQLYDNDDTFNSLKIYAANYEGNGNPVAVAQQQVLSFTFAMQATGEAVTLYAVTVSISGTEASLASAPTKILTLGSAATVPAAPMSCQGLELPTGVQIDFPSSPEASITHYLVYRGPKNGGFGAASQIATVNPSGEQAYSYLDTAGLTGVFEWYVVAQNSVGDSSPSAAIWTNAFNTSADLPPNVPSNFTNFATVDSIDNGTSATIRVYGTAGPGSSWTGLWGYGSQTLPAASLAGYAYTTLYYVSYTLATGSYTVSTSFSTVVPDGVIFVGQVTTVSSGGGGGHGGGGGVNGSGGCVEVGTPVEYPIGTVGHSEIEEHCFEWATIRAEGCEEVTMHPDTLVAVWKPAWRLSPGDLLDVSESGDIAPLEDLSLFRRPGVKVKRNVVPSRTYRARGYKLHNTKMGPPPTL